MWLYLVVKILDIPRSPALTQGSVRLWDWLKRYCSSDVSDTSHIPHRNHPTNGRQVSKRIPVITGPIQQPIAKPEATKPSCCKSNICEAAMSCAQLAFKINNHTPSPWVHFSGCLSRGACSLGVKIQDFPSITWSTLQTEWAMHQPWEPCPWESRPRKHYSCQRKAINNKRKGKSHRAASSFFFGPSGWIRKKWWENAWSVMSAFNMITRDSTPTKQELAVSLTCRSFAAVGTLLLAELLAKKPSLQLLHAEHSLVAACCSEFHGFPNFFSGNALLGWCLEVVNP